MIVNSRSNKTCGLEHGSELFTPYDVKSELHEIKSEISGLNLN